MYLRMPCVKKIRPTAMRIKIAPRAELPEACCPNVMPDILAHHQRSVPTQVVLCSPCRKFSIRCSEVRSENARMLMVVVLSVQFKNTLASHTYKFGTSCV